MMPRFFSAEADREVDETNDIVIEKSLGIWNSNAYQETQLPLGALVDAKNITPGTFNRINFGLTAYSSTSVNSGKVRGLVRWKMKSGTTKTVFAKNGVIYQSSSTVVESSLTNNNFEFAAYNDILYYVNGDDGLRQFDGTNAAAVTAYTASASEPTNFLSDASHAIHNSRYITVHEQVVYLASPPTQPYRMYRSDEVVGATYFHNFVDVGSETGGNIVWMRSFNGVLIVLKDDSVWAVDGLIGDASFKSRPLHKGVGCKSGRTVQEVPGLGLVFLGSDDHFYVLRPDYVSGENVPLFRLSNHIRNLAKFSYLSNTSCAGVFGTQYWCSFAGELMTPSYNKKVLAFDAAKVELVPSDPTSLFVPWSVFDTPAAAVYHVDQDAGTLWYGQDVASTSGAAEVYYAGESNDSSPMSLTGSPAASFCLPPLYMKAPRRIKTVEAVEITAAQDTSSAINPFLSIDNGTFTALDSISLTPSGTESRFTGVVSGSIQRPFGTYKVPVKKQGIAFQFEFEFPGGAYHWEITELRFPYTLGGRR